MLAVNQLLLKAVVGRRGLKRRLVHCFAGGAPDQSIPCGILRISFFYRFHRL